MKAMEMIGTSVRKMAKVKVTTDGDQRQHEGGECDYGSMERGGRPRVCDGEDL